MRGEVFDIAGTTVLAMGGAASNDRQYRKEGRSWWPEEIPSEEEMDRCRASLDRVGWKVDCVVTHEAPAALAEGLCRERGREYRGDRLQRFLAELDGRLGYRAWFFGHYHDDKWCDAKHRLIYRGIVPIEDAAPGSRNFWKRSRRFLEISSLTGEARGYSPRVMTSTLASATAARCSEAARRSLGAATSAIRSRWAKRETLRSA